MVSKIVHLPAKNGCFTSQNLFLVPSKKLQNSLNNATSYNASYG